MKDTQIKVGDTIWVDKGRLSLDSGELKSVDGFSASGFFGTYCSDSEGREKTFDQTVHKVTKKE